MIVKIANKSIAKSRNIDYVDYCIKDNIEILEELIANLVNIEIDKYENKEIDVLRQEDIDEMLEKGKVTFAFSYDEEKIDRKKATDIACQAFKDGLFLVFIDDKEIKSLNENINIRQNSQLVFIKLCMYTGRYY